ATIWLPMLAAPQIGAESGHLCDKGFDADKVPCRKRGPKSAANPRARATRLEGAGWRFPAVLHPTGWGRPDSPRSDRKSECKRDNRRFPTLRSRACAERPCYAHLPAI